MCLRCFTKRNPNDLCGIFVTLTLPQLLRGNHMMFISHPFQPQPNVYYSATFKSSAVHYI